MKRSVFLVISLLALTILLAAGCDKEKIVESTEYIETTEYITLPPDTVTVTVTDTVVLNDSVTINLTDTLLVYDTIAQTVYVHDTVIQVNHVYDTVTIVVIDSVLTSSYEASDPTALAAMQYYCNPLVLEFINAEFGLTDGWIFYLAGLQNDLQQVSATTFDIYGFIDYWTPDWSSYYPLEYYYRVVYSGGDPADPTNWQMTEPPAASPAHQPGVNLVPNPSESQRSLAK